MMQKLILDQVITSADVIQKGGLVLTVLKMALRGKNGAALNIELESKYNTTACLFSEDAFGLVVAVNSANLLAVQSAFASVAPVTVLGKVVGNDFKLVVNKLEFIDLRMSLIAKRNKAAFNEVVNVT